jgi:hypothetical protein
MKSIDSLLKNMDQQREKQKQEKTKRESAPKKSAPSVSKKVEPPKVKKKETKKEEKPSFGKDLKAAGKAAAQFFNPFDDVKAKDAVTNYVNRNRSNTFDEVARGANRVVDSASLGAMSNLDKKVNKRDPYYNSERKLGEGGGTDMITTGLGYLVPGAGFVKGAKATRFGAKEGTKGLTKALQLGKEGAAVGFAMGASEVGIREALNGKDTDWKDNAKHIAFGTATGAIADPVIHGVGKRISKGFESASNATMKKLLPSEQQVIDAVSSNKGDKANFKLKRPDVKQPEVKTEPLKQPLESVIPSVETNVPPSPQKPIVEPYVKPEAPRTKTNIDDELRSLDINDAYLNSGRRNKTITEQDYRRRSQENEAKRQQLVEQGKKFEVNVPEEMKPMWNNESKGFVLGDYNTRRMYGGGFQVQKAGQKVETFRTEEEAKRFMQQVVAKEKGIDFNPDVEGVLSWNSTYDEGAKKWNIQSGEYSIAKGDKNVWILEKNGKKIGTYKNEKKAREEAQRHYDVNTPTQAKEVVEPPPMKPQQEVVQPVRQVEPQVTPKQVSEPIQQTESPRVTQETVPPTNPTEPKPNERRFYDNVNKREKTSADIQQRLKDFDKTYVPMSNQETVDFANAYIKEDIEKAYQFVKNATKFDPRHITVGHRLIDEFQAKGEYDRALDVIERLAEQGTKHGQSIQAYSIYGRLTAQGQLLRAQRVVNRINESIPNPEKQVKLDEKTIQDITHAADSIQRLTGQEDTAKNVINIMDAIKKGKMANDDELDIIRSFVSDAKKFIGDTTPKKERVKVKSNDVRTRDKVVDFMNGQEKAAMERLKKLRNRANSLPVDVFYDLTVIGASKIAKGTVKFADFTEQMVQDFGEEIRPYMKQIWDKAAETFNLQSEKMTSKRLSDVEKIVNKATKEKTLTSDEAQAVQQYLNDYLQLTGDAKLEASMNLQATLQLLERPSFAGRISTAQTIAQLLNPKTIVRNAIGNELFYRVEQINKLVATPIDMTKSLITGSQRTVTFRSHNQGQYWHNWMMGLKAGWKGVNPMGLTAMYDLGPQAFRGKYNPMTYLEKALGATLRSFDHAGYMRAYNKSIGELATLRAMNEGLKGQAKKEAIARYIREADDNMKHISDSYAKYATFQDSTMLATGLQKVKKGMNKVSTLGVTDEFGLGDLVLKYPKTPGNLIMRALEYSPAGLIRSAHLLKDFIKTKNPLDQRETIISFTRAITGTAGFSMMGYVLADMGILTSSGHSDYEVATLERQAGKQANSVNITALQRFIASGFNLNEAKVKENDTFVSYDWAQPVSLAIALGTGINQSVKEEQEINPGKAAKKGFDSAANTVIEMSVLGGLNDFLANYPGRTFSDRVTDAGKGIASSFVPTFANQIRQIGDNSSRTTYSPNPYEEIGNKAINRIPGLQDSLPLAYDTLGKQRETFQNGSNNAFNVFLNPSFVSQYKPSEEAKFVLDYINQTGDKSVAPKVAPKKLDGIALTGEQQAKYQRIMGEETKKGLESLVPKAQGSTNMEKVKKSLEGILRKAGEKARGELRKELN